MRDVMMTLKVNKQVKNSFQRFCLKRGESMSHNLIKYMMRCCGYTMMEAQDEPQSDQQEK